MVPARWRAPVGSPQRDFYVWSDSPERYTDARVIFQDFEPSNWSWDPLAKAYYWHRFYAHQPDLNFDNRAVWDAIFPVVDFWLGLGVDGMRLDAVPYLYEREGTNCENLAETHQFLRALRRHVDLRYPGRMFLAEANQWPEDAVAYFGEGDECHMAFHFPLMPRLFEDEKVLVVANLSRFVQYVQLDLKDYAGCIPEEVFGRTRFPRVTDQPYLLTIGPHGFIWFALPLPTTSKAPTETSGAGGVELPILRGERPLAKWFQPAALDEVEALVPLPLRELIGGYLDSACLLGRLTAELHGALAREQTCFLSDSTASSPSLMRGRGSAATATTTWVNKSSRPRPLTTITVTPSKPASRARSARAGSARVTSSGRGRMNGSRFATTIKR